MIHIDHDRILSCARETVQIEEDAVSHLKEQLVCRCGAFDFEF